MRHNANAHSTIIFKKKVWKFSYFKIFVIIHILYEHKILDIYTEMKVLLVNYDVLLSFEKLYGHNTLLDNNGTP